jgi:hypothetical protein
MVARRRGMEGRPARGARGELDAYIDGTTRRCERSAETRQKARDEH